MKLALTLVLCVVMLPLAGQQAGTGTSSLPVSLGGSAPRMIAPPPGTTVKLVAIEEMSSATLGKGSRVHFRVWQDVKVDGEVILLAGTPVDAVVTEVRPGSKDRHRDGSIHLRLLDIDTAGYRIRLTMNDDFAPENIKHRHSEAARNVVETIAGGALVIALAPLVIPMGILMNTSSHKPMGDELELKPCFHANVYVRSARRLSGARIGGRALTPEARGAECVDSREALEFDGAFLEAVNRGALRVD
jgi:hypothetical protein